MRILLLVLSPPPSLQYELQFRIAAALQYENTETRAGVRFNGTSVDFVLMKRFNGTSVLCR